MVSVPETSPGGANVSLGSLQNSSNPLHDDCEPVSGGRDNSGGRVVSPRQVGKPWQAGQLFFI